MELTTIRRGSLVETVIETLREAVESEAWAVGERMPNEASLADSFGVGRNTVREAVRVLVHAGMLETRQGDGTYVRAQFDPSEVLRRIDRTGLHEQLEVRLTLEVEAARLAALRYTADDLAALREALDARATAGADLAARIRHDERFHRAVVAAAHNSALGELYRYFALAIRRTIERTETDADLPEPSQADHKRLYAAIEGRDAAAAAAAARALFQPSLETLERE